MNLNPFPPVDLFLPAQPLTALPVQFSLTQMTTFPSLFFSSQIEEEDSLFSAFLPIPESSVSILKLILLQHSLQLQPVS